MSFHELQKANPWLQKVRWPQVSHKTCYSSPGPPLPSPPVTRTLINKTRCYQPDPNRGRKAAVQNLKMKTVPLGKKKKNQVTEEEKVNKSREVWKPTLLRWVGTASDGSRERAVPAPAQLHHQRLQGNAAIGKGRARHGPPQHGTWTASLHVNCFSLALEV